MPKKYTSIVFLTVAYAILLGHNTIPHHHHTDHDHHEHHSDKHQHDHDNPGHFFAHFAHSADDFSFIPNHSVGNTFSKQQPFPVVCLSTNFSLREVPIPPFLFFPNGDKDALSTLSRILPFGLRAPPFFA